MHEYTSRGITRELGEGDGVGVGGGGGEATGRRASLIDLSFLLLQVYVW